MRPKLFDLKNIIYFKSGVCPICNKREAALVDRQLKRVRFACFHNFDLEDLKDMME